MSDASKLPPGDFNMPPGTPAKDIPGNDPNFIGCPACGLGVEPNDKGECPECGYDFEQ